MTIKNIHEAKLDSVKEISNTSAEFVIRIRSLPHLPEAKGKVFQAGQ